MPIASLRRLAPALCLILALANLLTVTSDAQQRRRAANGPPNAAKPVRLVVGIVIDQFRYEYLTRFHDQFGEGPGGPHYEQMMDPSMTRIACGFYWNENGNFWIDIDFW